MKKRNQRLLAVIVSIFMLLTSLPLFALENSSVGRENMEESMYLRNQYKALFIESGLEVPDNAVFEVVKATTENNETYDILSMMVVNGESTTKQFLLQFYEDEKGKEIPLNVSESIEIMEKKNDIMPLDSKTISRFNVTATCSYDKKEDSDKKPNYRPTKLSFVSTGTQNVKVIYAIHGWLYNQTTTDSFSIANTQTPAYSSQIYTSSKTAPYYYRPLVHWCQITTDQNTITLDVTSQ